MPRIGSSISRRTWTTKSAHIECAPSAAGRTCSGLAAETPARSLRAVSEEQPLSPARAWLPRRDRNCKRRGLRRRADVERRYQPHALELHAATGAALALLF